MNWLLFINEFRPIINDRLDWQSLADRLKHLNKPYTTAPWIAFGNEAKAALFLRGGAFSVRDPIGPVDDSYEKPSLEQFFLRASLEPITYSCWNRFIDWQIDADWALSIVGSLIGRPAKARSVPMVKPPLGPLPAMRYADVEDANRWLDVISAIRCRTDLCALEKAALIYGVVNVLHPVDDGNGRLSRVMFHASLCNLLEIDAPLLPLGPIAYAQHLSHLKMLREFSHFGPPEEFFVRCHEFISIVIDAQERIDSHNRPI